MLARIYRPAKTAMQSGKAKTNDWRLEFEPASARTIDPLMGWTSSTDMNGQVRLAFETSEEAVAYAERHGIPSACRAARSAGRSSRPMPTTSPPTANSPGRTEAPADVRLTSARPQAPIAQPDRAPAF